MEWTGGGEEGEESEKMDICETSIQKGLTRLKTKLGNALETTGSKQTSVLIHSKYIY